MQPTPYEILEVSPSTDIKDIRKAWKKRVRELHPDLHPEESRDKLNKEISVINQAWEKIRSGEAAISNEIENQNTSSDGFDSRFTVAKEIPLPYSYTDSSIRKFVQEIVAAEEQETTAWWLKRLPGKLLKLNIPRRDPKTLLFCAAVVVENKTLTYIFHTPIPAGRVTLIIPKLRKLSGGIDVRRNDPHGISLDIRSQISGTFEPFSQEDAEQLGLKAIKVSVADRVLDRTKIKRIIPEEGFKLLMYKA